MNYIKEGLLEAGDLLFRSIGGVNGLYYLISRRGDLFPGRGLSPRRLRQSVLRNLLKEGKDLRLVQEFAGHKYVSSTERYKQTGVEELKCQVLKFHPLG